jgi:enoyl-CoA hydratase
MLRVERDGSIGIWTIDRPQARNALNRVVIEGLARALDEAAADRSLRAIVLTGAGTTFASGGDLRELRDATSEAEARSFADAGERLCAQIAALEIPVIAALPGLAFGGGAELALACDLRIADASARISFKQVRLGVTTAWGTIPRLASVVGHSTAARLLYAAHEVTALEARSLRLVDEITDDGKCVALAVAWGNDIAAGSPRAVAEMKTLLRAARAGAADLASDERERFVTTWTSADHAEAVEAYFGRRAPRWQPR